MPCRTAFAFSLLVLAVSTVPAAETSKEKAVKEQEAEAFRRSTAVTLNYCRASFYRIARMPTLRVLTEEQEKILNNLDLNGIADQDVVKLYTSVLVEISEVRLACRERGVVQERYQTTLGTVLTGDAFDFGTQLASARYLSAIRTGARSWWDYRNVATLRDVDTFHVDQKRLLAFTEKTGLFLNTFWKQARDRRIPDRWLVRNQDLARLDAAMLERDPAVRLRVLKRMEDFMTCYPPYWYYVARTEQALGRLPAAVQTYNKLLAIGQGHFRKDEMLAAGAANQAVILDYLGQPGAADTAARALGFSTEVWEANLMCAQVLGRAGRTGEAEDAILRNLDVGLEREQSAVALVSLYTQSASLDRLCVRLEDPATVRRVQIPTLIRAAAALGPARTPESVVAQWAGSISAHYDLKFGADDFVLDTSPLWNLQTSEMSLLVGEQAHRQSTIALLPGRSEIRFAKVGEIGHPLYASSGLPPAVLVIRYANAPVVRLKLNPRAEAAGTATTTSTLPVVDMLASASISTRRQNLHLTAVQVGEFEFPVAARTGPPAVPPSEPAGPPAVPPAETAPAETARKSESRAQPPIPLLAVPKLPAVGPTKIDGPALLP